MGVCGGVGGLVDIFQKEEGGREQGVGPKP